VLLTYKPHNEPIMAIKWSPTDEFIATASRDHTVQVSNASTGQSVKQFINHKAPVLSLSWAPAPQSHLIVSADSSGLALVWNFNGQDQLIVQQYHGHQGAINCVSWGPITGTGSLGSIASGGVDRTAQIWAPVTGQNLHTYHGHSSSVRVVDWAPSGARIASSSDQSVRVWVVDPAIQELFIFNQHSKPVINLAWSRPDGSSIASVSTDQTVKVWKAGTGALIDGISETQLISGPTWSLDGIHLACGKVSGELLIWKP